MKSEENQISFCFIDGSGAGRSISEIKLRDFMSSKRELLWELWMPHSRVLEKQTFNQTRIDVTPSTFVNG